MRMGSAGSRRMITRGHVSILLTAAWLAFWVMVGWLIYKGVKG